ncbi:Sec-independent protein translocase subunit TatA [Arthrobacter sp. UYEF3]|uniref:Sec-independent protein translocase subunit TatA n=1 Tax=Arthrobacter sp. UYEF3 TaxID=1756365 RepID=UPI0033999278
MRLEGWHLIIIIVLVLVLFAAPRLPGMARSLGQSMRIFKSEVREMKKDDPPVKGPVAADAVEGEAVNRPKSTGAGSSAVGGTETPPPTSV